MEEKKGKGRKLLLTLLVLGLCGTIAGFGTFASFSSTTDNSGNSFQAGTVYVTDNDASCAMYQAPSPGSGACSGVTLDASNKGPNGSVQACIKITYGGTFPADVKMYWTPSGSDNLSSYMTLKVERGTQASPSFPSCTGWTAATSGTVTLYNAALGSFNTSGSPMSIGFPGSQTQWNVNDTQVLRITVTLNDDNNANGGATPKSTGSHSFTWIATNQ